MKLHICSIRSIITVLLILILHSNAIANKTFDSVVIFGDSLSDNGNLYRYMWGYLPLSPPYFNGRFSNGPVWAEHLYQLLYDQENENGFQDYAVGGAGAVLSYKENLPYTLGIEVNNYLYWHTFGKPEMSLFTIWIGANNYLNGPENIDDLTTGVVEAIGNAVEKLISKGGNKFIIGNLPDMGYLPQTQVNGTVDLLTKLTLAHNDKLARKVAQLKALYPETTILYFDAYSLFAEGIRNAERYGIINTSDPCYPGSYTGWIYTMQITTDMIYSRLNSETSKLSPQQWAMIKDNPQLLAAARVGYHYQNLPQWLQDEPPNCEGFMFWDHVHPSTMIHKKIAEHVAELIKQAGLKAINLPPDPVENYHDGNAVP